MKYTLTKELYSLYKQFPIISKDTRDISNDCIYFSLRGDSFDGNAFAKEALDKGAAYAVIDDPQFKQDERYLLVENSLKALQELANYHRKQLNIPFIGITGSNGKTTSKELIATVLKEGYKTHYTQGNYNNHIGVPLTILEITDDVEIAVIEMGANHVGEIDFLCKIAEPNFGLITNIGKAHLEGFGGVEGIKKGKSELYRHLKSVNGTVFINTDDQVLASLLPENIQTINYGKDKNSTSIGDLIHSHPTILGSWEYKNLRGTIDSPLYGEYNFYNILAAICIGNYFNITPEKIDHAIRIYDSKINRSQKVEKDNHTIYLDAYNANPTSMKLAIENFEKTNYKYKVVILGDMFELGQDSFEEHSSIVKQVANSEEIRLSVFVGEHFFKHYTENKNMLFIKTTQEAINWFANFPKENKAYLIKGSRGMKMETIIQ